MPFRLSRDARLIRFSSSDGLSLEGRLTLGARERRVVLCHPHPLCGGSMLAPVVLTAEEAFREAGYTTLAFNFRGVGGSQGTHGEGRAEVGDVRGALAFLRDALGGAARRQAVAGYSFGSVVGGRVAAQDPEISLYLGIAPPLNHYDFEFLGAARCQIALIGGSRDELCDRPKLDALYATLPGRPWLRVLNTDHFFSNGMDDLAAACREAIAWADGASDA